MSSWFTSLSEKVSLAAEKVSSALQDDTLLEKLTLTTPELKAERQALDASERRKEHVRNMLAGMLPWETRDPERDILVEECRDAVLQLSNEKKTFFGPYRMPKMDAKTDDDNDDNVNNNLGEDEKDEAQKEREEAARLDPYDPIQPSPESLEKLAKLEPLPTLLQDFDFSAHVGLIERILAEDKQLVKMQSSLSGGGARERIFWRNYFFHCAFTRYEAGLSIDEIWGDMTEEERAAAARQAVKQQVEAAAAAVAAAAAATTVTHDPEEETITFHDPGESDTIVGQQQSSSSSSAGVAPAKSSPELDNSSNKSYEIVDGEISARNADASGMDQDAEETVDDDDDDDLPDDENDDDYELDELEAEIARELED